MDNQFSSLLTDSTEAVITQTCTDVLRSLPRSDQRVKGSEYVRGLLSAPGRKSTRNMAAWMEEQSGDRAGEQNLHHFINSSTWDWQPLREDLARYTARTLAPTAWVMRPMVIQKAGKHSVGVAARFCPKEGRTVNGQLAIGSWLASERFSAPLNWRLHLGKQWGQSTELRSKAGVPEDHPPIESVAETAVAAYQELAPALLAGSGGTAQGAEGLAGRGTTLPAVYDVYGVSPADTARILRSNQTLASSAPITTRIESNLPLTVIDPALAGLARHTVTAAQIAQAAKASRREEYCVHRGKGYLLTSARVLLPELDAMDGRRVPLFLVSLAQVGQRRRPAELWLTTMERFCTMTQIEHITLTERVEWDFWDITDQVGARDFSGRSFTGWHRHTTLASIAHVVAGLSAEPKPMGELDFRLCDASISSAR